MKKSKVIFFYADVPPIALKNKTGIKRFVADIFKRESVHLDTLSYIFCSDGYLSRINREFLNHDDFTDIITFDLSSNKDGKIGEIYISVDRVKENAGNLNLKFSHELLRVIFHGALHLCGYKDKKKSEITIMRGKEDYYLTSFEY